MAQGHLDSLLTLTDEPQSGPSTELSVCVCVCVCVRTQTCACGVGQARTVEAVPGFSAAPGPNGWAAITMPIYRR